MEWTADGIILGARPFGEADALLEIFTRETGRAAGLVHGGASSKKRAPENLPPVSAPINFASRSVK